MFRKAVMLGVIGIMAMGVSSIVFGCGNDGTTEKSTTQQAQKAEKQYVHLKVDNALDLIAFLGKDIKALNIPEEAIEYIGARPFTVYYDTSFLGQPCDNVMLGFTNDYATKTDKVNNVYITIKNPKFWDCKAYLDKQLGECHDCGTTPYAFVNGGALTYFTYYKDGIKYHLSMGSANIFYRLVLSLGVPKNPPNRQSIGLVEPAGFMGVGMMSSFNRANAAVNNNNNNKETWVCSSCGSKSVGKFCGECGTKRAVPVAMETAVASGQQQSLGQAPRMLDGPGMMNVNYWKHEVLDGGWMSPVGDLALEIKGFDFKFGIYKAEEPDNFRWQNGRFYFAGWQNSSDRAERYDLLFSDAVAIKDAEGKVLVTLREMWHEKRSVYLKLEYPGQEGFVIKELRKPKDIVE